MRIKEFNVIILSFKVSSYFSEMFLQMCVSYWEHNDHKQMKDYHFIFKNPQYATSKFILYTFIYFSLYTFIYWHTLLYWIYYKNIIPRNAYSM